MPDASIDPGVINVLFLAAEAAPLVKVGGLGDVAGSLPLALRALTAPAWKGPRIDIRLVLPFHDEINRKIKEPKFVSSFLVDHPGEPLPAKAFETTIAGLPVYLIEGPPIPPDTPAYSNDPLQDGEKYTFFSLAAIELARQLKWRPDLIHANDWHTATSLYALKQKKRTSGYLSHLSSLITIHNLPFMGKDAEEAMIRYGLPRSHDPRLPRWATLFPLPLGLLAADHIVAVSPGYADEILTPEFGCGLQDFLNTRKASLSGILNGLDQNLWNPAVDAALTTVFDADSIEKRTANKKALLNDLELPTDPDVPLLVMVSRLDQQKGVDIAIEGLRRSANLPWQAVILGTGDPLLESAFRSLEAEFPHRVRSLIRFDGNMARQLYGSGDLLLMPSRYEPCGLAQMIAMHYGCLPLARATGGLKDTICDDPTLATSTGFLFEETTPESFAEALSRAIYLYPNHENWQIIQRRGMQQDFTWEKSAVDYAKIYTKLVERVK